MEKVSQILECLWFGYLSWPVVVFSPGFSILSGVEILFFVAKFILSCGRSKPLAAVKGIISNKAEAAGDKVDDTVEEQ